MTHEYTILAGGTVLTGDGDGAGHTAIAWAGGIVLALGPDAEVRAISRGDSHFLDLAGAVVVPLGPDDDVSWPPAVRLEVGGQADLAILDGDPRGSPADAARPAQRTLSLIRAGRVISGSLPLD